MSHDNGIPRRNRLDLNTPEELAITEIINKIEERGPDVRLTNCVVFLSNAKDALSDYIDDE